MLKIGLTGGIGSGKTTVAKMFIELGIPVYFADPKARELMEKDQELIDGIKQLLGDDAYTDCGELDRIFIAKQIFGNDDKREELNFLLAPILKRDFDNWSNEQIAPYVIQEAAILFETGSYKNFDKLVLVTAPEHLRINRVVERDGTSMAQVKKRMDSQWKDAVKIKLADYIIVNENIDTLEAQVKSIDRELSAL
ncbi:MAG: dephospho-CoA kinase [Bacteroidales bacterium]